MFSSGKPLVGASSSLGQNNRRFVPGLDGRLYISSESQPSPPSSAEEEPQEEGQEGSESRRALPPKPQLNLQRLEITVFDVLENPIRTCSNSNIKPQQQQQEKDPPPQEDCGLLTATKATSLFALDTMSGGLTWYQDPTGKTQSAYYDDSRVGGGRSEGSGSSSSSSSTVLLQRQDVLVKQISTDSGEQVWNVTLGTLQALDFGVSRREFSTSMEDSWLLLGGAEEDENMFDYPESSTSSLPTSTPSTTNPESPPTSTTTSVAPPLPSVIFGPDGTSLAAVDPLHPSRILWKRTFETVVASAFGLSEHSWKSLDVIEDDTMTMRMMMRDDVEDDVLKNARGGLARLPMGNAIPGFLSGPSWRDKLMGWSYSAPRLWTDVAGGGLGGYTNRWRRNSSSSSSVGRQNKPPQIPSDSSLTVFQPPTWQNVLAGQRMYSYLPQESQDEQKASTDGWLGPSIVGRRERMQQKMAERYERRFTSSINLSHEQIQETPLEQLQIQEQMWQLSQQPERSQTTIYNEYKYHYHRPPLPLLLPSPSSSKSSTERKGHMHRSAEGIFLTWQLVTAVVLVVVTVCGLGLRWFYNKKKSQWLQLLARAMATTQGDGTEQSTNHSTDKLSSDSLGLPTATQESLGQSINVSEDKDDGGAIIAAATSDAVSSTAMVPSRVLSSSLSRSTQPPKNQGVGMIDGIPLIQYSRYSSEFEETLALGKGGFGTVFRCKNALDGREYAIKKVFIRHRQQSPQQKQLQHQPPEDEFARRLQRVLREVKILAVLDHPNIVRYYTAWLELEHGDEAERNPLSSSFTGAGTSDYYAQEASTTQGFPRRFSSNNLLSHNKYLDEDVSSSTLGRSMISADLRCGYRNPASSWDPSRGGTHYDHYNDTSHVDMDDLGFTFDRGDNEYKNEEDNNVQSLAASSTSKSSMCREDHNLHSKTRGVEELQCLSETNGPDSSRGGLFASRSADQDCTSFSVNDATNQNGLTNPTPTQSNQQHPERTEPEASACVLVRHTLYIQMQLCSEQTLADFLSNKEARRGSSGGIDDGVDIPYALSLFVQIAQGVQHVHGRGLIHRDLKPNNCFIDNSGVVKVGDFGLSRESGDKMDEEKDTALTSNQNPPAFLDNGENTAGVGTRSYASPEQMKGSDYDSSTDVYSLGLILFELCYPMYTVCAGTKA
jgi:serine/threonine protein kinase